MAKVEADAELRRRGRELAGDDFEDALAAALAHVEETGATFVHPYEDERVIAGQGTIGLELAEQVPDAGTVLIPVGGGGLALGHRDRRCGRSSRTCASSASRPGVGGYTIADGIAVKTPGEMTMPILESCSTTWSRSATSEISRGDRAAARARRSSWSRAPGAVGVAALLAGKAGGEGPAVRDPLRRQHRPDAC